MEGNLRSLREGVFFGVYRGRRLMANANLTTVEYDPVKKRWWDRVAEWNPCNVEFIKPDFTVKHVPDRTIYGIGDMLVAHPVVIDQLRRESLPLSRDAG